jgi:hypothetical protein
MLQSSRGSGHGDGAGPGRGSRLWRRRDSGSTPAEVLCRASYYVALTSQGSCLRIGRGYSQKVRLSCDWILESCPALKHDASGAGVTSMSGECWNSDLDNRFTYSASNPPPQVLRLPRNNAARQEGHSRQYRPIEQTEEHVEPTGPIQAAGKPHPYQAQTDQPEHRESRKQRRGHPSNKVPTSSRGKKPAHGSGQGQKGQPGYVEQDRHSPHPQDVWPWTHMPEDHQRSHCGYKTDQRRHPECCGSSVHITRAVGKNSTALTDKRNLLVNVVPHVVGRHLCILQLRQFARQPGLQ